MVMVWHCMKLYFTLHCMVLVWYGWVMVQCGMVGMVFWYSMAWYVMVWNDMV